MAKFIIAEDVATWVRNFYRVEAATEEEARKAFGQLDYDYLGFSLKDNVESSCPELHSIEQTNITPRIKHPA